MGLDFDYVVPKTHSPSPRIPGGVVAKESKGKKGPDARNPEAPGPGQYLKHISWAEPAKKSLGGTKPSVPVFTIPATSRDKGLKANKVPGVGTYDKKTNLTQPRVIGGVVVKGPKRSMIDRVKDIAAKTPGPGEYKIKYTEDHIGSIPFNPPKTVLRNEDHKKRITPGPGEYKINYAPTEKRTPRMTWTKQVEKNFVDKVTSQGKDYPSVGTYEVPKLEKIARGTKLRQLRPDLSPKLTSLY
jgi:hypothetical protein